MQIDVLEIVDYFQIPVNLLCKTWNLSQLFIGAIHIHILEKSNLKPTKSDMPHYC